MNLIITGGAGFIGSNLARYLIEQTDHHVLVIDKLTYAGNPDSLSDLAASDRFQFRQIDICDADEVQQAFDDFQPTAILHLAAESHVDRSIDGPEQFIQTNIVGTYRLLEVARSYFNSLPASAEVEKTGTDAAKTGAGSLCAQPELAKDPQGRQSKVPVHLFDPHPSQATFRFVHVSTDEVYGELTESEPAFTETTSYTPRSPYSASKASSDHLARAWFSTYGLPVIVTNCSNNYGPYQFPEKLIPVVILKAIHGEPIPVYGRGANIRDWLYVEDHARALLRVIEAGIPGQTYNIGGQNEQKNIDLVRKICQLLDELQPREDRKSYQHQITFVQDRPGHDLRYAIDNTKIKADLNWQPKESFESGLRKTVSWYLTHIEWRERILSGQYQLERLGTL